MGEIIKTKVVPKNKTNLASNESSWMQTFRFSEIDIGEIVKKMESWEIGLDKAQLGS